jgi:hypothetical protein
MSCCAGHAPFTSADKKAGNDSKYERSVKTNEKLMQNETISTKRTYFFSIMFPLRRDGTVLDDTYGDALRDVGTSHTEITFLLCTDNERVPMSKKRNTVWDTADNYKMMITNIL